MYFWFPFFEDYHHLFIFPSSGISLSDMHFVYSLAKALAMVSSPAFNVSMLTWSFPVAFSLFIFFRAALDFSALIV